MKPEHSKITPDELAKWKKKFRILSGRAKFAESFKLASKLMKQYPNEVYFAYREAVMTAEDTTGLSQKEAERRYKLATSKFRALLRRTRGMDPESRFGMRNEYYWFSKQPRKQYALGLERVKCGVKRGYYSQGVGAERIARLYAIEGRKSMCVKWAKISEKAWLNYFKIIPDWFNSYFFYAAALGYQGRLQEMDTAFAKAAKIAKKPKNWKTIQEFRAEVLRDLAILKKKTEGLG